MSCLPFLDVNRYVNSTDDDADGIHRVDVDENPAHPRECAELSRRRSATIAHPLHHHHHQSREQPICSRQPLTEVSPALLPQCVETITTSNNNDDDVAELPSESEIAQTLRLESQLQDTLNMWNAQLIKSRSALLVHEAKATIIKAQSLAISAYRAQLRCEATMRDIGAKDDAKTAFELALYASRRRQVSLEFSTKCVRGITMLEDALDAVAAVAASAANQQQQAPEYTIPCSKVLYKPGYVFSVPRALLEQEPPGRDVLTLIEKQVFEPLIVRPEGWYPKLRMSEDCAWINLVCNACNAVLFRCDWRAAEVPVLPPLSPDEDSRLLSFDKSTDRLRFSQILDHEAHVSAFQLRECRVEGDCSE